MDSPRIDTQTEAGEGSPAPGSSERSPAGRWWVYLLRCADGTLYTGATVDLEARVACHNRGKGAAYTRSRLPVVLVHSEACAGRSEALRREAALKKLDRRQKLALVAAALVEESDQTS